MNTAQKLAQEIKKAESIAIISHVGPDGDTLGSMLALREMIETIDPNKKIDALILGKIPDIYNFLPGIKQVKSPGSPGLYGSYGLAIAVDCASIDRLNDAVDIFRNAKVNGNIDHHISNNGYAYFNVIDSKAAATGEIIYRFAEVLGVEITKKMAINLYTAILTDTGGFKFTNTRPETLETCANLIRKGANPGKIYKNCYESKPLPMVKLHAYCVDNAVVTEKNRIAYTFVSRNILGNFEATDDHLEGISETLRQIDTVEVAMVFKETLKGHTKVSFRSNGPDVCQIAKFFGGGGHKLASGCTIEKNLADSLNEVLPILKKQINR